MSSNFINKKLSTLNKFVAWKVSCQVFKKKKNTNTLKSES